MGKFCGWMAFFAVPVSFVLALVTGNVGWFPIGLSATLAFAALAIMLLEPHD